MLGATARTSGLSPCRVRSCRAHIEQPGFTGLLHFETGCVRRGPDRCQGVNCSGTIVVTIADKSDVIEKNNDQLIPVTQYKMKVNYYDPQGKPPLSLSLSEPKSTTAQLVKKKNGAYWALKP